MFMKFWSLFTVINCFISSFHLQSQHMSANLSLALYHVQKHLSLLLVIQSNCLVMSQMRVSWFTVSFRSLPKTTTRWDFISICKRLSLEWPKSVFSFLPRSIYFADKFIVAWKRGIAIISAGTVKVTPDPRIRLANGYSLEIREAVPQDAGDYICQIATLEPREITHTVEILGELMEHSPASDCKMYRTARQRTFYELEPMPSVLWMKFVSCSIMIFSLSAYFKIAPRRRIFANFIRYSTPSISPGIPFPGSTHSET